MPTETDTLIENAVCIDRCIPDGLKLSVLIAIFAEIANMSTDTDTLIAGAKCVQQCIPPGMELSVLIYLADQINQGGGGGAAGVTCGHYDSLQPDFTPTTPCDEAIDLDSGQLWFYYNGGWNFSGVTLPH